jgi:hypothetical protein
MICIDKRTFVKKSVYIRQIDVGKDPRPEDVTLICPQRGFETLNLNLSFTGVMEPLELLIFD